ncbi:DUF222 domain-containing protein [Brachybacterium sacelli]|uniref:HNH endonuclease n=2 Tax=Bacteria TaxID=2 RepID=A0ABS4X0N2_9MICO|nr:DUF222 domain-containing protein [Brachybacterium sacelli]MBP2381948.1 hypothetical protein [Brachybacterium sacelli]
MATALQEWTASLARACERAPRGGDLRGVTDAELIDSIGALERMKGAISAAQARAEIAFRDSQVELQRRQGVARALRGRGVADQIGLARRITPKQASDQVALHRVLVESLPRTIGLLERGEISEWAAHEVAKNVVVLHDEDRALIDAELETRLPKLTATRSGQVARARAQELDPVAAVVRAKRAVAGRRASLRPAPDGMSIFRAVLPTKEGVSTFKALTEASKSAKSSGDARNKGQIMADTLVERVTGAATVDEIPVEVNLLMTDTTLLNDDDQTAWMDGHPIPGRLARDIALGVVSTRAGIRTASHWNSPEPSTAATDQASAASSATDLTGPEHEHRDRAGEGPSYADDAESVDRGESSDRAHRVSSAVDQAPQEPTATPSSQEERSRPEGPPGSSGPTSRDLTYAARWIRRLYTDPRTGELVAADPRRRLFRGSIRRFILLRDQRCRTPWCDAAIHDIDHVTRHAEGGETTTRNGIGHCQRFNLVKEIPGWETASEAGGDGAASTLTITTPTGHRYTSTTPALRPPSHPPASNSPASPPSASPPSDDDQPGDALPRAG